jgi:hypothetical protein
MRTSPVSARRARKVLSAALLAGLLFASACTKDKPADDTRRATTTEFEATTTAPEPTTTTKPEAAVTDPTKVPADPDDITAAYAQAVLDKLFDRYRGAAALAGKSGKIDEAVQVKLHDAYAPAQVSAEMTTLQEGGGAASLAKDPRAVDVTVRRIADASEQCILVVTRIDISGLLVKPIAPSDPFFVRLERKLDARPGDVPWRIGHNYSTPDDKPHNNDRCA